MTFYIAPVVEGQTEQACINRLLHRVWHEILCRSERLQVMEPFRGHRDELVHANRKVLIETTEKAYLKLKTKAKKSTDEMSMILILLDAENDCPATLAPRVLYTAKQALPPNVAVACVLAKRMLENWIVAGASTLAGINDFPNNLPARDQIEDRSGVAWIETQLRSRNKTRKYRKTVDAEHFIRIMDLQECRTNSPSFDKLCRELEARLPKKPDSTEPKSPQPPPELPTTTDTPPPP